MNSFWGQLPLDAPPTAAAAQERHASGYLFFILQQCVSPLIKRIISDEAEPHILFLIVDIFQFYREIECEDSSICISKLMKECASGE